MNTTSPAIAAALVEPDPGGLYDTDPSNFSTLQLSQALRVCARLSHLSALADGGNGGPEQMEWEDIDGLIEEADEVLGEQRVAVLVADACHANGVDADEDEDDAAPDRPRG